VWAIAKLVSKGQVASGIGSQGSVEHETCDTIGADFPTGKFPTEAGKRG
jgi:hypothetical protein